MTDKSSIGKRPQVLIVGSGVAGLETLLALRDLAGDRVRIGLLSPDKQFVYRPLTVAEPFGLGEAYSFDLARLLAGMRYEQNFVLHSGSLIQVDTQRHCVHTSSGQKLSYEMLVIATGAQAVDPLPGAVTFSGKQDGRSLESVLPGLIDGSIRSVVFALTSKVSWTLPIYELALMTVVYLAERNINTAKLSIVTVEEEPLGLFGSQASLSVRKLLKEQAIELHTGRHPVKFENGELLLAPSGELIADRVVTLAELKGPHIAGLPTDQDGFIPVDQHGQVSGLDDVYAAGDATIFPIKQGGLAAQQACAVAEAIAARVEALADPKPFRPVLRGLLLTGAVPRYLHAEIAGGKGDISEVEIDPLWWPPSKIAGGYLAPYLAEVSSRSLQPDIPPTASASAIPINIELGSSISTGGVSQPTHIDHSIKAAER